MQMQMAIRTGAMEHGGREVGDAENGATVPLITAGDPAESWSGHEDAPGRQKVLNSSTADSTRFFTVEEAINHVGFGRFQLGMVTYTGLVFLADAVEMILLSFVGPAAKCEWGLSPFQEGLISSLVFVGLLVGSFCWGVMSDLSGRRFSFFATTVFTTVFGLISAWSPTFWILLLSRTFVGFGLGGASVAFSLCMEFLPEKGRGFWLVLLEVFWTIGSIGEALLAWVLIPNVNWRWLIAVSALPFVCLLMFYPILPESPRYLMVKGDTEGAISVLRRVARVNGKSLPPGLLTAFHPDTSVATLGFPDQSSFGEHIETGGPIPVNDKLAEVDPLGLEDAGALDTFKLLFSPELKKSTCLLWFMFFANAFTYYGLVLLTTELEVKGGNRRGCDNVKGLQDNALQYCDSFGKPLIQPSQYRTVLISCIAEFPGLLVACLIVDKFGQRMSLASLLIACGIFMLPLITPFNEVITNVLMFGSRSCIMGGFSILWAYAPELFYTKVRTTGIGTATSGARLGGFLCPFIAVGLVETCRRVLAVGLFAFIPVIAGLGAFLFPKEIKKLT